MADFPTSLDNVANDVDDVDASLINTLQAKVGADSSAVTSSHDYKLSGVTGSDKAASKTGTETLTNKTLTSPAVNLGSDATGDIYYRDSSGNFVRLAAGSANQYLEISGGIPSWQSIIDEDDMSSNSATRVPSQQSVKAYVDSAAASDGWLSDGDTWTYASATTITVSSDARTTFEKGDKIRLKQGGGYKYYYLASVAETTLTLIPNDTYTLADAAITNNGYSKSVSPIDFPKHFLYTPTWTGFSSDPSQALEYFVVGNQITIFLKPGVGTSNSATLNFTLPVAEDMTQAVFYTFLVMVNDNNTWQDDAGVLGISAGTAKVGKDISDQAGNLYGGFTTSGNKTVSGVFTYTF